MKLCSACLLGVNCRYDGTGKPNQKVIDLSKKEVLIPVCPEQLGGMTTPRLPAELRDGKAIDKDGLDVTESFTKGALEVLRIAKLYNIDEAILKSLSPSCGCGKVHDGSFSGSLIEGDGITAGMLKREGINVITEEEL